MEIDDSSWKHHPRGDLIETKNIWPYPARSLVYLAKWFPFVVPCVCTHTLFKILNSRNLVMTAQGALHFSEELHSILGAGCGGKNDYEQGSETEPYSSRKDERSHSLTHSVVSILYVPAH